MRRRLTRAERSPQWRNGRFQNRLPTSNGSSIAGVGAFLFTGWRHRTPHVAVPVERRVPADYRTPPASGLRVTWLGHSTLLLEIDGRRVLIDPVWGEYASPIPFAAKRFFAPPLALADLPAVDAVVISHDHYDHLEMLTVKASPRAAFGGWRRSASARTCARVASTRPTSRSSTGGRLLPSET